MALERFYKRGIKSFSQRIARGMQAAGYRGFAGIDYMIYHGKVFFTEVNPRMQSSTDMLVESLQNNKLPNIIDLGLLAFYDAVALQPIVERLEHLVINAARYEMIWWEDGDENSVVGKAEFEADGASHHYNYYEPGVFLAYSAI